ncbi:unnamed protein product [Hymenolepis diminuta]|uniref:Uncharacterized protein n=1 Tax=Hymenolepis diminuta TaxID=6216 RepID=A0A564YQG7_HYMDI|nr:unnamed protein product [Hymenolepis diminuta]
MSRRRCLGMMIDICLDIYVQTHKHTAGPPVDTVSEILSPVDHFYSPCIDRHLLAIAATV